MKIRKAVIPAAGMGTRFMPATKSIPKEMIPILDVPMIQYIVEEAVRSGLKDIVLITARHKDAIDSHFDFNPELEAFLESKQKKELAEVSRALGRYCNLISIRQKNPAGLGHAVLCAAPAIGDEPFAVLLGDDLIDSEEPCTAQMIRVANEMQGSVVAIMEVAAAETSKYGIVSGVERRPGIVEVNDLVEKPKPEVAPSRWAIPGRYILESRVFDAIRRTPVGAGGEIQLTDALRLLARESKLFGATFSGVRYDTGDRMGYLDATLAFSLRRPELKSAVESLILQYADKIQKNRESDSSRSRK
jgi:UTP--glucose-1-phosphate uridylyltransferase